MSNRKKLEELANQLKRLNKEREFDPTPNIDLFKTSTQRFLELLKEATFVLKETFEELKEKATIKRKYYEIELEVDLIPDDVGVIAIKNSKGQTVGYIVPSELDDLYGEALVTAIKTYVDQLKK